MARSHQGFHENKFDQLQELPLQQIWLDYLLALQLEPTREATARTPGTFVLLYPVGNIACAAAAASYRRCLTVVDTFDVRTLDEVVQAARLATSDSWPDQFYARYVDPASVNAALKDAGGS
jgi:hypothetical protein